MTDGRWESVRHGRETIYWVLRSERGTALGYVGHPRTYGDFRAVMYGDEAPNKELGGFSTLYRAKVAVEGCYGLRVVRKPLPERGPSYSSGERVHENFDEESTC